MKSWKDFRESYLGRQARIRKDPFYLSSYAGRDCVIVGITNLRVPDHVNYAIIVKLTDGTKIGLEPREVIVSNFALHYAKH